jgi:hypothetical protein
VTVTNVRLGVRADDRTAPPGAAVMLPPTELSTCDGLTDEEYPRHGAEAGQNLVG